MLPYASRVNNKWKRAIFKTVKNLMDPKYDILMNGSSNKSEKFETRMECRRLSIGMEIGQTRPNLRTYESWL